MKEKVLLGMSGGLDSAYSCKLLLEQGYEVVGAFGSFHSLSEAEPAMRLGRELGISVELCDFSRTFEDKVIGDLVNSYSRGLTPNPCAMCNKYAKFPSLVDAADRLGIENIATGHYARLKKQGDRMGVSVAADKSRDQSYFLWKLGQDVLKRLIFPLADVIKKEIPEDMREKVDAKESRELCFCEGSYIDFLLSRGVKGVEGDFVDREGRVLGKHHGVFRYTVGQRKGLDVVLGRRAYVLGIDAERLWRIFFYYRSRRGAWNNYIDMISKESVQVLIEAVYLSHWNRYKEHFGNTIAGFFSDEPAFVNQIYSVQNTNYGFYEQRIGSQGLALPWNENVRSAMTKKLGFDPTPHLNLLWYEDSSRGDDQAEIRFAYMDTITELYQECFTKQLSDWCHAHGVLYTGHIIEDMGSSSHLHHNPGHYFRSMTGQDMSGIDIVFQQVMPGMEHHFHSSSAQGIADGEFFHYVLGKLGASFAHLNPDMKGRAMCEMFGAYGWGLDTPTMKYIIDFLLVRGINRFVPHAFGAYFPDPEFPPHFSAEGNNPSFEGFSALMKYINRAAHVLYDSTHLANAAILYDAEGEWSGRYREAMPIQPIAKLLYDAHIDYDIVSMDMLEKAKEKDKKLILEKECFDCLIVPYSDHLPLKLQKILKGLDSLKIPVWFFKDKPENAIFDGTVIKPEELIPTMKSLGMYDVSLEDNPVNSKLRIYHCFREKTNIYMFFNENFTQSVNTKIKLPTKGEYLVLDLLEQSSFKNETQDGNINIKLLPNQSKIIVFTDTAGFEKEALPQKEIPLEPEFSLELAPYNSPTEFKKIGSYKEFFNVNGSDHFPDFSGKMRYSFEIDIPKGTEKALLDLGRVGQNASLKLNEKELGIRVSSPYIFDISSAIKEGKNSVQVVVSNTLAQQIKDRLSYQLPLAPSGLLGEIKLYL